MADKLAKVGDMIKLPKKNDPKGSTWVVINAEMTGGGTGHGPHDIYPDAWHVSAMRVSENGGVLVGRPRTFTQNTNCYNDCIDGVELVGKWKKPLVAADMKALTEWMVYYNPEDVLEALAKAFADAAGRTGLSAYMDLVIAARKPL